MSRSISQLREQWATAKANLIPTTAAILNEHGKEIVDLNRNQLFSGRDGYGDALQTYADARLNENGYAAFKHDLNPAPGFGTPDLKLTGSLYEKMRARVNGATLNLDSEDAKATQLKQKYGEGIFKMDAESINTLRKEVLQEELVHALADQTGAEIG